VDAGVVVGTTTAPGEATLLPGSIEPVTVTVIGPGAASELAEMQRLPRAICSTLSGSEPVVVIVAVLPLTETLPRASRVRSGWARRVPRPRRRS
jgi:hypothetical protein